MSSLPFTKMHGAGNDFVVLDGLRDTLPPLEPLAAKLCDRNFGIGADQVERRRQALGAAIEAGRLRAWVVWLDDEPVAVARLSQGDGVAGLQGIGVVDSHRGQGYGTLITTIATRAGMATGNRIVWLSVNEDNDRAVSVYRALGFQRAFGWTRWLMTEDPRRR